MLDTLSMWHRTIMASVCVCVLCVKCSNSEIIYLQNSQKRQNIDFVSISSTILEPNVTPAGGECLAKGDNLEGKRSERGGVSDGGRREVGIVGKREVKHPSVVGVKGQGNPHGKIYRHTIMYAHTHVQTHKTLADIHP